MRTAVGCHNCDRASVSRCSALLSSSRGLALPLGMKHRETPLLAASLARTQETPTLNEAHRLPPASPDSPHRVPHHCPVQDRPSKCVKWAVEEAQGDYWNPLPSALHLSVSFPSSFPLSPPLPCSVLSMFNPSRLLSQKCSGGCLRTEPVAHLGEGGVKLMEDKQDSKQEVPKPAQAWGAAPRPRI